MRMIHYVTEFLEVYVKEGQDPRKFYTDRSSMHQKCTYLSSNNLDFQEVAQLEPNFHFLVLPENIQPL